MYKNSCVSIYQQETTGYEKVLEAHLKQQEEMKYIGKSSIHYGQNLQLQDHNTILRRPPPHSGAGDSTGRCPFSPNRPTAPCGARACGAAQLPADTRKGLLNFPRECKAPRGAEHLKKTAKLQDLHFLPFGPPIKSSRSPDRTERAKGWHGNTAQKQTDPYSINRFLTKTPM